MQGPSEGDGLAATTAFAVGVKTARNKHVGLSLNQEPRLDPHVPTAMFAHEQRKNIYRLFIENIMIAYSRQEESSLEALAAGEATVRHWDWGRFVSRPAWNSKGA
jgi:hypothetical protein